MTKAFYAAAAALVVGSAVGATAASATVFAGTVQLTAETNANRLTVTGAPSPASFGTANLAVGQSALFSDIITVATQFDASGCLLSCGATDAVSLTFAFTSPAAATVTQGGSATEMVTLFGALGGGGITWANATNGSILFGFYASQEITFSNGAMAQLDVYNVPLVGALGAGPSLSGGLDVRLRNLRNPLVAVVPEPAGWATMIVGFGLIGAALRHRRERPALA